MVLSAYERIRRDGTKRWVIWDMKNPQTSCQVLLSGSETVGSAQFTANDQLLFIRTNRGLARLDMTKSKPQVEMLLPDEGAAWATWPFAISPNGRWVSGDFGAGQQLIPIGGGNQQESVSLNLPTSASRVSAFSPNGRLLATADGRLRLWDVPSGTLVRDFGYLGTMSRLYFTPDGRHLITVNTNSTLYVLRLSQPPKAK